MCFEKAKEALIYVEELSLKRGLVREEEIARNALKSRNLIQFTLVNTWSFEQTISRSQLARANLQVHSSQPDRDQSALADPSSLERTPPRELLA
ncbi:hypothetical protein AAC387_Pa01g2590 [Persea americana]